MAGIPVLHLITGLNVGGAEYMLARFGAKLAATHYEPSVLSLMRPGPVARDMRDANIAVATLEMHQSRPGPRALAKLRAIIRSSRPALLHGWMYHGNVAASVGSLLGERQPVIWSIHHSIANPSSEKLMTRAVIRLSVELSSRTSAISYCSRVSAEQHEALGFAPDKRRIIPNGVDCEQFHPRADARRYLCDALRLPAERLLVGNIARAHPMKDHGSFLRAIAGLRGMGLDAHGILIGDGHEQGGTARVAAELGITPMITISNARADIDRLMPGLDLFMLSSAWGEAFPLVVAEAMASGVPAIATDVGDCAWLVGDRQLVVEPKHADGLAKLAASILCLSQDLRRELGERARRRIVERFSLRCYVDSHLSLYDEILDQQPIRAARQTGWRPFANSARRPWYGL
ncbi:glycosyltransferase [Ensifer adhaerens]|uniref:glycosyltransferase n=1 Tax=Ensifer adhaerens TaxID=106592 RepID=UPI0009F6D290|nr:glycosyltransferase [Ensifer adhaerens]